jgi:hydroxyacylglutathione hydrolase
MQRRRFIKEGVLGLGLLCLSGKGIASKVNRNFKIRQFVDEGLSQFAYAIYDNKSILLIDPARNIQPYLDFAEEEGLDIIGVIETHPHADFVSGHAELQRRLHIPIYVGKDYQAEFPHKALHQGDHIVLNSIVNLRVIHTPGHSPESISLVLVDQKQDVALFSGDTLLFGNVGRPDLRDVGGDVQSSQERLARAMYRTVNDKLSLLDDRLDLYPAHGAGSLCASGIRDTKTSTIGHERMYNPAFKIRSEEDFVSWMLSDLGVVPAYFSFDVYLNLLGAPDQHISLSAINVFPKNTTLPSDGLQLDTRGREYTAKSFVEGAIQIPGDGKFETWLGTIILPGEKFYLLAEDDEHLQQRLLQIAKIGYERQVLGALVWDRAQQGPTEVDIDDVLKYPENYHIIDVRNEDEARKNRIFSHAVNVPLPDLIRSIPEIHTDKPIVVHCASGYRSAIGSSLLRRALQDAVIYDCGVTIKNIKPQ